MINIWEILITKPLGFIIDLIGKLGLGYGWSIIIFTIIIKLILLPLNIKSQNAMRKQQKIQPLVMELQKKYANDQQKLQMETMKLYKENKISMMGGCLPLLIQFPILIGLWNVIRAEAEKPGMNFDFFGLDLSKNPNEALGLITKGNFSDWATILLILIPILAMATTWLSTWQSQRLNKQPQSENSASQMTKGMSMIMPLFTGFFALSLPAGMGLYWITGNIFQLAQQYFVNLYFSKKEDDFIVTIPEKNRKKGKKR